MQLGMRYTFLLKITSKQDKVFRGATFEKTVISVEEMSLMIILAHHVETISRQ